MFIVLILRVEFALRVGFFTAGRVFLTPATSRRVGVDISLETRYE
jgi:hypothetical protein